MKKSTFDADFITGVVMEEIGGLGMRRLLDTLRTDYAILGEATENNVARGHRGRFEFIVRVFGRSVYPRQDLLNLGLVEVGDERDAADLGGLMRQACQVVAGNVFHRKLSAAAHELAKPLRQALIVCVEPQGASWDLFEFFVAEFLAQLTARQHIKIGVEGFV